MAVHQTRRADLLHCGRETTDVGEALTMLTTKTGPDIALYHDRQIVILDRRGWAAWLDPSVSSRDPPDERVG